MEHLEASQFLDLDQPRQLGPLFDQAKLHVSECAVCRKAWLECQALKALALEASLEVEPRLRRNALQLAHKINVEERLSAQAGPDAARKILLEKNRPGGKAALAPLLVALAAMVALVFLWRGTRQQRQGEPLSAPVTLPFEFSEAPTPGALSGTAETPGLPPQEAAEERELDGEARRMLVAHLNKENRSEATLAPTARPTAPPTAIPTAVPTAVPTRVLAAAPAASPGRISEAMRAEREESTVDLGQPAAADEPDLPLPSLQVQQAQFAPSKGQSAQLSVLLPEAGAIEIRVFDSNGKSVKLLADGKYGPGRVNFKFGGADDNGKALAPGSYYARVMTRWFSRVETLEKMP